MEKLREGLAGETSLIIMHTNTAKAAGSGSLDVFATPCMIALMEKAACMAIASCLDATSTSVGIKMSTSHIAATKIGEEVVARATVSEVDGRRVVFNVEAKDGSKLIGKGTHERFIVNVEKFMSKL